MPRLDAPGVLHHIMVRGIERNEIFISDKDREDFIVRLSAMAEEGAMDVYAWALFSNHFHTFYPCLVMGGQAEGITGKQKEFVRITIFRLWKFDLDAGGIRL
jgi:hypothetical protein